LNRLHLSIPRARRALVVLVVGALAATAVSLARDPGVAHADQVSVSLTRRCDLGLFGSLDVTVPVTTNDTPGTVEPGGTVTLDISAGLPQTELDSEVTGAKALFPIPTGLTLTSVTFSAVPGTTPTFSGNGAVQGSSLALTYQATAASTLVDGVLPMAHATFTVDPNLAGTTINWPAPTSITADLFIGIPLSTTCSQIGTDAPINTTQVSGTPVSTTTTTAPTDPWTAFINWLLGFLRYLVCLFTGSC
jgi:hypothetical protein